MNRKRMLAYAAAVWVALLLILTAAEHGAAGSGIRTVWDAAWYSFATLSTAGYGDLVPVTPVGRIVGVLLMLMSVGVWAALIGIVWTTLRDRVLPGWRLAQAAGKPWYVFSERNEASEALARDLAKQDKAGAAVFCSDGKASGRPEGASGLSVSMGIDELTASRFARKGPRTLFLMNRDGWDNASAAETLAAGGMKIYSRGEEAAAVPGVHCFDPAVMCARQYWLRHPAGPEETVFLIIGDGERARALLLEGLTACCREPFHETRFRVSGDWADFRRMHPEINDDFQDAGRNADREEMEKADRIILAAEDERANAEQATAITRAFPLHGTVHAATALPAACDGRFGLPEEIYTGELVMHQGLDRMAVALHRAYGERTGDRTPWETLSPFLKDSNRAAADHLLTKIRLLLPEEDVRRADASACRRAAERYAALSPEEKEKCLRNEHARWCLFHRIHNWRYAPARDNSRREHPCLTSFDSLCEADRDKDGTAWDMIGPLAKEAEL